MSCPSATMKWKRGEGLKVEEQADSTFSSQNLEQDAPRTAWSRMSQPRGRSDFFIFLLIQNLTFNISHPGLLLLFLPITIQQQEEEKCRTAPEDDPYRQEAVSAVAAVVDFLHRIDEEACKESAADHAKRTHQRVGRAELAVTLARQGPPQWFPPEPTPVV